MRTAAVIPKYLALLLLSFSGFVKSTAQIRLAAYGGIHSANVIEKNDIPGWDTAVKNYYSPRTGFHIGAIAEIPLGHKGFYFQPAVGYTSKGRQFYKNYDTTLADKDTIYAQNTLKLGYMEIPLYLTYKIPLSANHKNSFFISAGPYFAFFYNGSMNQQSRTLIYGSDKYQYNDNNVDLLVGNAPDKYKTFDFGIDAKAGFEFGNIMLSGYFSRGLTSFYTATYPGSFHHQLIGATLGIWLTKAAPIPPKIVDTDHDGIPDNEDLCPTRPGSAKWHGCPVPDSDGDGIDDEHDSCKTVPGIAKYNGCPVPDSDGDGIDDEHDSCKTVPGVAKYNGCPIPDTDGDGVNDEEDKCPNEPGTIENQGCPVIKIEVPEKISYEGANVLFKSSSSKLTESSYQSLNGLADTLNRHPDLHLTIEGYTDSTGTQAQNLVLSQQRADEVKNYLVSKGIAADRVTAIGYGEQKPLGSNKTQEGKALNRRVEFRLNVKK
ncbi:MAG TPA: OmpA family protein [Puia sp.]|nr:OmpA family protein [Puia sp.]